MSNTGGASKTVHGWAQEVNPGESFFTYIMTRILRNFGYEIKVLVSQKMNVYFHEFKKCNTDIYVCYDAALLYDCQGVISLYVLED